MFKSIFQRMFLTNAAILVLVFISVAVSVSIFVNHYTLSKQMEDIISVSDTVEHLSVAMQIESPDDNFRAVYRNTLRSWAQFLQSDIIVVNQDGELTDSTCDIRTVPESSLTIYSQDGVPQEKPTLMAHTRKKCFQSVCPCGITERL